MNFENRKNKIIFKANQYLSVNYVSLLSIVSSNESEPHVAYRETLRTLKDLSNIIIDLDNNNEFYGAIVFKYERLIKECGAILIDCLLIMEYQAEKDRLIKVIKKNN